MTGFNLGIKSDSVTEICVDFYADGRKYYSDKAFLKPGMDGCAVYRVRIPKYSCGRFAFEIKCDLPDVGFTGIEFGYLLRKDMKNYKI